MIKRYEEKKVCAEHGAYMAKGGDIGIGRILWTSCPSCLKRHDEEEARAEEAEARKREIEKLEKMGVPFRFVSASIAGIDGSNAGMKKELARNILEGSSAILFGKFGVGKTYFACAILREKGDGIYSTAYGIATRIRSTYSEGATETEADVLRALVNAPILVIDELGRTKGSQYDMQWLSHVVDGRYQNMLPTVLITNAHNSDMCGAGGDCPDCLHKYVPENVMSRIMDGGAVCNFSGSDRRGA